MQSLRLGDARTRGSDGGVARIVDATQNTDPRRSPPHSDYTLRVRRQKPVELLADAQLVCQRRPRVVVRREI